MLLIYPSLLLGNPRFAHCLAQQHPPTTLSSYVLQNIGATKHWVFISAEGDEELQGRGSGGNMGVLWLYSFTPPPPAQGVVGARVLYGRQKGQRR